MNATSRQPRPGQDLSERAMSEQALSKQGLASPEYLAPWPRLLPSASPTGQLQNLIMPFIEQFSTKMVMRLIVGLSSTSRALLHLPAKICWRFTPMVVHLSYSK